MMVEKRVFQDNREMSGAQGENHLRGAVTTNGITVTYKLKNDFTCTDSFSYTIRNWHGRTATVPVNVTVTK
jgi:hypothetical protein